MKLAPNTPEKIRDYFRVKAKQLAAVASLPICDHSGLAGSHREQVQRIYLREILPKRFEIGRGMVYGVEHRSYEADVLVWDSIQYPSLPMADHSLYFAESFRAVMECKSRWSVSEFHDVQIKAAAIHKIKKYASLSLADEVNILKEQLGYVRFGRRGGDVPVIIRPPIGTACVFLKGGTANSIAEVAEASAESLDEHWPDITLTLGKGILAVKVYDSDCGRLEIHNYGKDALFAFTCELLAVLTNRAAQVEGEIDLWSYFPKTEASPVFSLKFPVKFPRPTRRFRPMGVFHFEP